MNYKMLEQFWQKLKKIPDNRMTDARNQLHWAVQVPASIGYTYVKPESDWSHISLTSHIDGDQYILVSASVTERTSFRAGLLLKKLRLVVLDNTNRIVADFDLNGHTLNEGYTWLKDTIHPFLESDSQKELTRPDHELPAHPVSEGMRFDSSDTDAFIELSKWYFNAELVLHDITIVRPEASPVRCWPHHFDIATLLLIDTDKNSEEARSVGVGFVPGDSGYTEPYWYVTPWPYPENPQLPKLSGGHWHQEGWFGAVLPGSELVDGSENNQQLHYLAGFLDSAIAAAIYLING